LHELQCTQSLSEYKPLPRQGAVRLLLQKVGKDYQEEFQPATKLPKLTTYLSKAAKVCVLTFFGDE
jgi:hypothetical protein